MNKYPLFFLASIFTLLIVLGCSSATSPVTPGNTPVITAQNTDHSSRVLWGIWDITVDTSTGNADVVPLRGAMFTANVNNILEGNQGNMLIQDMDISEFVTEGRLDCTITLKHPFPGLDQYHGFDVRGVFMHNGSKSLDYENLTCPDPGSDTDAVLLNADGYTRWFNYSEFDGNGAPLLEYFPGKLSDIPDPSAMLNGYKNFADGLDEDASYATWILAFGSVDRGIFKAGQVNSRRYELKFPMPGGTPEAHFQYAVIATWEPGDPTLTGSPAVYDPFDFPSSANCDEAFAIRTYTDGSTLYNDGSGQSGGKFAAAFEVFDWQGGIVSELGVPYEISRIIVEGDFLPGGSHEWSQAELLAVAVPASTVCSVFQVEVNGCSPDAVPGQDFWVVVESSGLNGDSYGQGFPTEFPDSPRAAFYRGSVPVSDQAPQGFSVSAIDPDTVPFWSTVDDATISGTDFVDGATVELRKDGEDPVDGLDVAWISSTQLTCDFDLADVDSGVWDVVVINPGGIEGVLESGFTIDVWSEEMIIEEAGNRTPQMAETSDGDIVLGVGCNDNTMKYLIWESAWDGPYVIANLAGHSMLYMTSDPVNDYVYLSRAPKSGTFDQLYRYTGGTGLWEVRNANYTNQNQGIFFADPAGNVHTVTATVSSYGHIVHCRASAWTNSWILPPHWFYDSYNDKELSMGSIWCQDSNGQSYVIYEKDRWKDPYSPGTGRYIKLGIIPQGDWVQPVVTIDVMPVDYELDSPAITVDSSDNLHAAWREYNYGSSSFEIQYKNSTNSGQTWGSDGIIWSGASEPVEDYVFINADSLDNLHSMFEVDGYLTYTFSSDGSTWSDTEVANESADSLPSGIEDFMPRMLVTSEDIMHVSWIRGNPTSSYGDIYHRMRDLD